MPYAPGFERALKGIAHGWKPDKASLRDISETKAKAMLSEAERKKKKHQGQVKALREA